MRLCRMTERAHPAALAVVAAALLLPAGALAGEGGGYGGSPYDGGTSYDGGSAYEGDAGRDGASGGGYGDTNEGGGRHGGDPAYDAAIDVAPAGVDPADVAAQDVEPLAKMAGEVDLEPLRTLTIQDGGRRKPLDTFARERVKLILGTPRFQGEDPLYTLFALLFEADRFLPIETVRIRNLHLVELLGKERSRSVLSFAEVNEHEGFAQALSRIDPENPYGANERAVLELHYRRLHFARLEEQLRMLPIPGRRIADPWAPIVQPVGQPPEVARALRARMTDAATAWRSGDAEATTAAMAALADEVRALQQVGGLTQWKADLEVMLNRTKPFRYAWMVLLGAALLLGAAAVSDSRWIYRGGIVTLLGGLGLATWGLTARWLIDGRAPVANLYEATVFAIFATVLAGTLFEARYRNKLFGAAAAVFGALAFMLADVAPGMDRSISPLVPVLNSYWLNIHVTAMLLSYGILAIAFVLGIFYFARWFPAKGYPRWSIAVPIAICAAGVLALMQPVIEGRPAELIHFAGAMLIAPLAAMVVCFAWVKLTGGGAPIHHTDRNALAALERYIYRAIQVGFLVLTAGVLLGAVWANESWGRYWDWDPKETWAFITLLIYGVFIHGRIAGWFRGPTAAIWSVIGFYSVLFTFYGVSFVLPGLHSYLSN